MSGFKSFGSMEEMFDYMAQATEVANANLSDEQRALTWGSYWFRPYEGIVIFGWVFPQDELERQERASYGHTPLDPEEEAEFAYAMEHTRENHERGYLFGKAYSVWEPSGELGDTHRASAWPITAEQFTAAQEAGWDHEHLLVRGWLEPLWRSIVEGREGNGPAHRG